MDRVETMPMANAAQETEIKLRVESGAVAELEGRLAFESTRTGEPRRGRERSRYFDTPDLALARAGVSLRVREHGDGRIVQTIKVSGRDEQGAAAPRQEHEWLLIKPEPDVSRFAEVGLPAPNAVEPVFATEVDRIELDLALGSDARATAALDDGRVIAGDAAEPVREIELELRSGPLAPLYRFALTLQGEADLMLSAETKADIGWRLLRHRRPAPIKPTAVTIPPTATTAEGFRRIMRQCIGHLVRNQPATLAGDPEGVHQMRVAVRRIRSALRLFRGLTAPEATNFFIHQLRWLGRVLGDARDWDVFIGDVLAKAGDGSLTAARRRVEPYRDAARDRAIDEIRSAHYKRLALRLAAWVETDDWQAGLTPAARRRLGEPLAEVAPRLIGRLADQVQRRGRNLGQCTDQERHALRRSLKKLRYAAEFLAGLYPHDRTEGYVTAVERVQDALGRLNDATVAAMLAETAMPEALKRGPLDRWMRERRAKGLDKLPKRWRAFKAAQPFW